MKKLKIIEFAPQGPGTFVRYLRFLAQRQSWEWTFETHPEFAEAHLESASVVQVHPSMSAKIIPHLQILTSQVRAVETLDSFFKEGDHWYPRLLFHEALRLLLVEDARDLHVRSPAFVVGDNEEARAVAAVLADLGFSSVFLVGDVTRLQQQRIILSRSQLGIQFHLLQIEDLTLQAVSAGLVINLEDLSKEKGLFTDLSYFNYMASSGYVLDLNLYPVHNILLEEAERAGLRVLLPARLMEKITLLWAQRMNLTEDLSKVQIHESWNAFLQENSSSV